MYIKLNYPAPSGGKTEKLAYDGAIVGLQYRQSDVDDAYKVGKFCSVIFSRDKNNPVDPNAIAAFSLNHHIGYLPQELAEYIVESHIPANELTFQVRSIRLEHKKVTGIYGDLWRVHGAAFNAPEVVHPRPMPLTTKLAIWTIVILTCIAIVSQSVKWIAALVGFVAFVCLCAWRRAARRNAQGLPQQGSTQELKNSIEQARKTMRRRRTLSPDEIAKRRKAVIFTLFAVGGAALVTAAFIGGFLAWFAAVIIAIAAAAAGFVYSVSGD